MGNKSKVCVCVLQSKLTWGPYFWFHMWRAATSTISGVSTLDGYTPLQCCCITAGGVIARFDSRCAAKSVTTGLHQVINVSPLVCKTDTAEVEQDIHEEKGHDRML